MNPGTTTFLSPPETIVGRLAVLESSFYKKEDHRMTERLLAALQPIVQAIDGLDPASPEAAHRLEAAFPINGPMMKELGQLVADGVREGWLCDKEAGPTVRYSRVAKAIGDKEFSIDAVAMSGAGPEHTHPNGEFDLCFAVDGAPTFDGNPPGWTVYGPDSHHTPSVQGGTMNILYFLPGGAIRFGPRA